MKRRRIITASGCTLALFATTAVRSEDFKHRTLRVAHQVNKDHPISAGVRKFAELVESGSGGKIKVREFPAGQLGPEQQTQAALQGGSLDFMVGGTSAAVGVVKDLGLIDLPFLFSTEQQADRLLDGPVGRRMLDQFAEKGTIGLAFWDLGLRNVTNNRNPVNKIEDLKGLKIRVPQSPIFLEVFRALGANAVPMAFGELFTALETRTVDAQETPNALILSNRYYEVQRYLAVTHHAYSPLVAQISKKLWDGMSPAEQRLVRESMEAARDYQRVVSRDNDRKAFAELKAKGMAVSTFSDAERDRMRAAVKPAVERLLATYDTVVAQDFMTEVARVTR